MCIPDTRKRYIALEMYQGCRTTVWLWFCNSPQRLLCANIACQVDEYAAKGSVVGLAPNMQDEGQCY